MSFQLTPPGCVLTIKGSPYDVCPLQNLNLGSHKFNSLSLYLTLYFSKEYQLCSNSLPPQSVAAIHLGGV
jgi:hypothetical protein